MFEPTLCLTIGDPQGIGPEITAKLLAQLETMAAPRLIVIGSLWELEQAAHQCGVSLPSLRGRVSYINIPGNVQQEAGTISYMALEKAVELIKAGKADALVTGPISKENLHRSGIPYAGHTEILEALAQKYYRAYLQAPCQADMLFVYRTFRMLLLTRHVPLHQVPETLTRSGVTQSLENVLQFLTRWQRIPHPRLAVMGVNPHGGEVGGDEERQILMPAMRGVAERFQIEIPPPFPADALFRNFSMANLPYDAYIATYHDQGLIPFKMIAGYQAVNVTIGLPFLRTSVSHGTAPDIVGQGIADPSSMQEAIHLATQLLKERGRAGLRPEALMPTAHFL